MRAGSVHVHFCTDGSEPAASLHVGDDGIHDLQHPRGADVDSSLFDSDVSVPGDTLVKKVDADLDLPAVAIVFALLLFLVAVLRSVRFDWGPALLHISDPTRLRPPLRGPPA